MGVRSKREMGQQKGLQFDFKLCQAKTEIVCSLAIGRLILAIAIMGNWAEAEWHLVRARVMLAKVSVAI